VKRLEGKGAIFGVFDDDEDDDQYNEALETILDTDFGSAPFDDDETTESLLWFDLT
jgi:hypothetical protein